MERIFKLRDLFHLYNYLYRSGRFVYASRVELLYKLSHSSNYGMKDSSSPIGSLTNEEYSEFFRDLSSEAVLPGFGDALSNFFSGKIVLLEYYHEILFNYDSLPSSIVADLDVGGKRFKYSVPNSDIESSVLVVPFIENLSVPAIDVGISSAGIPHASHMMYILKLPIFCALCGLDGLNEFRSAISLLETHGLSYLRVSDFNSSISGKIRSVGNSIYKLYLGLYNSKVEILLADAAGLYDPSFKIISVQCDGVLRGDSLDIKPRDFEYFFDIMHHEIGHSMDDDIRKRIVDRREEKDDFAFVKNHSKFYDPKYFEYDGRSIIPDGIFSKLEKLRLDYESGLGFNSEAARRAIEEINGVLSVLVGAGAAIAEIVAGSNVFIFEDLQKKYPFSSAKDEMVLIEFLKRFVYSYSDVISDFGYDEIKNKVEYIIAESRKNIVDILNAYIKDESVLYISSLDDPDYLKMLLHFMHKARRLGSVVNKREFVRGRESYYDKSHPDEAHALLESEYETYLIDIKKQLHVSFVPEDVSYMEKINKTSDPFEREAILVEWASSRSKAFSSFMSEYEDLKSMGSGSLDKKRVDRIERAKDGVVSLAYRILSNLRDEAAVAPDVEEL